MWFISSSVINGRAVKPKFRSLFCAAIPSHTARQKARGYTWHFLARPHVVSAWRCGALALSPPLWFVHCLFTRFKISGELLMSLVRFCANAAPPWSSMTSPKAHMSHTAMSTPHSASISITSGMFHEVAE